MKIRCVLGLYFLGVASSQAGMTVVTLSDVARSRLEVLSFFIVGYLLMAWGVKGMWNYLAKSFERMPKLNYKRALCLSMVSGLFLYVVLTMISGARELLTPGAWEKRGVGYDLRDQLGNVTNAEREESIKKLKNALWAYAEEHGGKLPTGIFDQSFYGVEVWQLPQEVGYYGYIKPESIGGGLEVLVYEPAVAGGKRWVVLTDGSVQKWNEYKLQQVLMK